MSLAKLLRRALQSTDWGLVFYLGVLVCLAVYVVSVAVQGYRRRKAHRAQVEARRAEMVREQARARRTLEEQQLAAAGNTSTATDITSSSSVRRRRGRDAAAASEPRGTVLGETPRSFEAATSEWAAVRPAEQPPATAVPSSEQQQRGVSRPHVQRDTAHAMNIARDIALKWNEGALPQPPPLSSFSPSVLASVGTHPSLLHARAMAAVGQAAGAGAGAGARAGGGSSATQTWESAMRRREIEEQDAAYQAALERDRARERAAAEAAAKEQAERDAAAKQAAEAERRATARAAAVDAAVSRLERVPEPSESDAGAFPLLVRLPDGRRATRRFHGEQPVQLLVDWLHATEEVGEKGFVLTFGFPSRELVKFVTDDPRTHHGSPALKQTLTEAGVHPREVFHLHHNHA